MVVFRQRPFTFEHLDCHSSIESGRSVWLHTVWTNCSMSSRPDWVFIYMSLNISGRQIPDGLPPQMLADALARHSVEAWRLVLEITEGVLMADVAKAQQWMAAVREQGIRFYLDDFGTGYSSLAYLKKLPVNELKIDKSFVMAMEKDEGDAKIVRSTIDLAHNLGLSVVAEGVENATVLALLHELKCDEGQGYHMSKPLPIAQFCDWVARWQARPPASVALPAELRVGSPLLH